MGGFIKRSKPVIQNPEPRPEPKPIVETTEEKRKYDDKKR